MQVKKFFTAFSIRLGVGQFELRNALPLWGSCEIPVVVLVLFIIFIEIERASGVSSISELCRKDVSSIRFFLVDNKNYALPYGMQHKGRCALKLLIDSLKRHKMLVDTPEEADFYIYNLPNENYDEMNNIVALSESIDKYMQRTILGVNTEDGGWFYRKKDAHLKNEFYSRLGNATLLSYYGLENGRKSVCFKRDYICIGNFRPGKDIVVPGPNSCQDDFQIYKNAIYHGDTEQYERYTLLYFAGNVKRKISSLRYGQAGIFRLRLSQFCKKEPSLCKRVIVETKAKSAEKDELALRSSIFCLNPPGKYGGYAVRISRLILNGCIPVNIMDAYLPFQDFLPYENFSLNFPAHFSPRKILSELQKVPHTRIAQLQLGLRRNYNFFTWGGAAHAALATTLQAQRCN